MYLLSLVLLPLLAAIISIAIKNKKLNISFFACLLTLILAVWGLKDVLLEGGQLLYVPHLPGPFVPSFQADSLTSIFVILASLLFLAVSLYSPRYMEKEGGGKRFSIITLVSFSFVLGVFLAGNLITLLLFFELMTVSTFFWVIHRRNKEAFKAGNFYLYFSIIGGLLIALAIVLLGGATDILPSLGQGAVNPTNPSLFAWSLALFMIGFGIKAGMAPLHLWLPHAHSVSPTPGSALLSGLVIKIGAYGLIRVGEFAGWGQNLSTHLAWMGPAIIVLGISTMLVGVIAALLQGDGKRLLAYHSVSQMGYIILGLGLGLYLGQEGALGLLGSIYHIINHALFKAVLFLGVGLIYFKTNETDLYKLGGLWRQFPLTALLMFLAILGITGTPGLNGYASKTLLHHGLSQAALVGPTWLTIIDKLFLLVGVGTTASFAKLFYLIFLGKPTELKVASGRSPQLRIAMVILVLVMVFMGLNPSFFPNKLGQIAAQSLGISNVSTFLAPISYFNLADILGMVYTLAAGIIFCWLGLKTGLFHWQPPVFLSLEGLGGLFYALLAKARLAWLTAYNFLKDNSPQAFKKALLGLKKGYQWLNQPWGKKESAITVAGIGLEAAILIFSLITLLACYALSNPRLPIF